MDSCILRQREQRDGDRTPTECLASDAEDLASQVAETAKDLVKTCRRLHNIGFDALPDWGKDNEYVKQGYRPSTKSFQDCFKSVFRWHNETGNIWTHLIGFAVLVALAVFTFSQSSFGRVDYVGIVLLISGSHVAAIFYAFYCHPYTHLFYTGSVVILGSACATFMLIKRFQTRKYRTLRAYFFLAFGLFGVIPVIHILIIEGLRYAIDQCAVIWMILMASSYILGVTIYVVKVPECWFPGKCDFWIHSHQIFHVLVLCGIWLFYNGLLTMAEYRRMMGPSCAVE
ncbi:adiponectin receptor protein 2-like isoform X2 [Corticium candelabrum]|uniref:adiponectin receptor protein 2-like isoform X2 n=1 Tax=Corticium candelabrum TaxID=121492 RepID=UPI002E26856A|nr:adiponectin receptor protein 2-like isoform X2 [Corticium candelabrum]